MENITRPAAVQHELDTYNALIPQGHELSSTLLVEYPDAQERDAMLPRLVGLQHAVTLTIAGVPDVAARFDPDQYEEGRISAVQFVRFPLTDAQLAAFCDLRLAVTLTVTHPAYTATTPLPGPVRGALVEDLLTA